MFAVLKHWPRTTYDLRRRRPWKCCQTGSAFCARPRRIISPGRMTSMSVRTRCAALGCAPATPSRGRSARPAMGNAISPRSRSTGSISRTRPAAARINFDNLTPLYPRRDRTRAGRFDEEDLTTRVLDLITRSASQRASLYRRAHRQDRDAAEHRAALQPITPRST